MKATSSRHIVCTVLSVVLCSAQGIIARKNSSLSEGLHRHHTPDVVVVIGTGYVGLVTGAGLAEFGNTVVCADIMKEKIDQLNQGRIPIFEPELKELVEKNVKRQRLSFTHHVVEAIQAADIIIIAVGTPRGDDGCADLTAFYSVIETIATHMNKYKVIITKSTVPIGTGMVVQNLLIERYGIDPQLFDLVSNPEFLREGSAVRDFLLPDRLVVGIESERVLEKMYAMYAPLIECGIPHVLTNIVSAEMIKYASNAFLATKLSFINEIANLCDKTGADVHTVACAMGLDKRISPYFLRPGPGFGGSCFPKDIQALLYTARNHEVVCSVIEGALETNERQKHVPVEKLTQLFSKRFGIDSVQGKCIAVLGLAFKGNTDDIRFSPAITVIQLLLERGARVKAYDPLAMEKTKEILPDVTYCTSAYEAAKNADAVIIMTEWEEFKNLDMQKMGQLMRAAILVDARGLLHPDELKQYGFLCETIGQSYLCQ
jgi:UDPglucose 6-dehydrogenase